MSGAANCPETPRQKMIGMMYLVLTAMLALNVSTQVLEGFTMVDNSLHTTIESSEARNLTLYQEFEDLNKNNPAKTKEWLDKANNLKKEADILFDYIQNFKIEILKIADKDEADVKEGRKIVAKGDYDSGAQYALLQGNGKKLKAAMQKYQDVLLEYSKDNPKKQAIYKQIFQTSEPIAVGEHGGGELKPSWEQSLFEHMPVGAVIAVLTKYQSDVRTAEAEMVSHLKAQTDAMDFRVNKVMALVIPNSRYVIRGGQYSAQIVLSAVDSTKSPKFTVGGSSVEKGLYQVNCGKTGSFNYTGLISFEGNDGTIKTFPFKSDYIVGEPSATLSNVDLNVVYRGVENKFSISVPGVADENVTLRVAGGTAQKSGKIYIIKPTQDGKITINVYAKIDGKDLPMGGGDYRVKYLPDPTSYLQYKDGGGIARQIQDGKLTKRILKSDGVNLIASYGADELIQANFNVVSFSMVTIFGTTTTQGARFNSKMLSDIDKLEGGDLLTFKNIKAVGPDGKVRQLGLIQVEI